MGPVVLEVEAAAALGGDRERCEGKVFVKFLCLFCECCVNRGKKMETLPILCLIDAIL